MNVIIKSNRYFCKIENFAYGEINERSFSNPPGRFWSTGIPTTLTIYNVWRSFIFYYRGANHNACLHQIFFSYQSAILTVFEVQLYV